MLRKDREREVEDQIHIVEYLASFINPAAVSKVKESREKRENNNFMKDSEFEQMLNNKEFLKQNIIAKEEEVINKRSSIRETKLPKDLKNILKINRDNF
jgi:hypothetical protein